MNELSRYSGALTGLAVGDALGTALEFKQPGTFEPIEDIIGGGPFGLQPGEWTDDTSMALCLAKSLVEKQGFDANDQMARYVRWWKQGYMSSNGRCFDIGVTTSQALSRFLKSGDPFSGDTETFSAGNGSLMRLAPIPMAFASMENTLWEIAAKSSATTHATRTCLDACSFYASLIAMALKGIDKAAILDPTAIPAKLRIPEAASEVLAVAEGSYKHKKPPEIRGSGYVVDSLEASLWAFYHSDTFEQGALMAVNLGDDADTTGAIYGQLAGAYYGIEGIPEKWRNIIVNNALMKELAESLFTLSQGIVDSR